LILLASIETVTGNTTGQMVLAFRFALLSLFLALTDASALAEPCRAERVNDTAYIVCGFDLSKSDLRLFWRNTNRAPFRTFTALASYLADRGEKLQFAMNGGMYDEDYRPIVCRRP
jgi:uncharacterized protein YigE (DUF2233 family)